MSDGKEDDNKTEEVKEESKPAKGENDPDQSKEGTNDKSEKSENEKDESNESNDGSEKEESDEEDEQEMGLLDRPVEVTGCRARKKVERLEYAVTATHKEKTEIPEGKGEKLGDCPRIEHQIQKTEKNELKPLHKILFNKAGAVSEIKKNIRKFCGFGFDEGSSEFERKKAGVEKLTSTVLKRICDILDIERSGTKEEIVKRIMVFLCNPKNSGKAVVKKKSTGKKTNVKKAKTTKKSKPKSKKTVSTKEGDLSLDSDSESPEENENDSEKTSKPDKTPVKKISKEKKEKSSNKGAKRKRSAEDDKDDSSEEKPNAKKVKMPSDEEIKKLVKRILDSADLQEITMKKVIKQVADAYPDCDLSHKKAFIKTTIKSVIS